MSPLDARRGTQQPFHIGCGEGLQLVRCSVTDCDGDGVQSHSRIDLLEDVSFGNIGRHEVNCKAGVQETKNTQPLVEVSRE